MAIGGFSQVSPLRYLGFNHHEFAISCDHVPIAQIGTAKLFTPRRSFVLGHRHGSREAGYFVCAILCNAVSYGMPDEKIPVGSRV